MSSSKFSSQIQDFHNALERLKEAASLESTPIYQDATIQRFEFTFEIAWKTMQTFLMQEGLTTASPRETIRRAADIGIIQDPTPWFGFLEARNQTVHTYREETAKRVYEKSKQFIDHAEKVLHDLEKRRESS